MTWSYQPGTSSAFRTSRPPPLDGLASAVSALALALGFSPFSFLGASPLGASSPFGFSSFGGRPDGAAVAPPLALSSPSSATSCFTSSWLSTSFPFSPEALSLSLAARIASPFALMAASTSPPPAAGAAAAGAAAALAATATTLTSLAAGFGAGAAAAAGFAPLAPAAPPQASMMNLYGSAGFCFASCSIISANFESTLCWRR
mmetsp:Transcript_57830/g.152183  ORF Transcript_57830/g.152183 Transcript_57830/m.152183 type:complete len:203 (-) Transcript_57830:171-779(-)